MNFTETKPESLLDNPFKLIVKNWTLITAVEAESFNTMTRSWGRAARPLGAQGGVLLCSTDSAHFINSLSSRSDSHSPFSRNSIEKSSVFAAAILDVTSIR
jgi:hypothetical protein